MGFMKGAKSWNFSWDDIPHIPRRADVGVEYALSKLSHWSSILALPSSEFQQNGILLSDVLKSLGTRSMKELALQSQEIGKNFGLDYITEYVCGARCLIILALDDVSFLDAFQPFHQTLTVSYLGQSHRESQSDVHAFAIALNNSRLRTLTLNVNPALSQQLFTAFAEFSSPSLRLQNITVSSFPTMLPTYLARRVPCISWFPLAFYLFLPSDDLVCSFFHNAL
jgi:hypothetical protein